MTLNELSAVPSDALPFAALSEHLHLGSGFEDDGVQNAVLEAYLRAAIAAIESRSGVALLQRRFSWSIHRWSKNDAQRLPLAPVKSVELMRLIFSDGAEQVVGSEQYVLRQHQTSASLLATKGSFPNLPHGGSVEIIFEAGYGENWSAVPADLQAAVMQLAAHNYEYRSGVHSDNQGFPKGVLSLLQPYQSVRVFGGAA